MQSPLPKSTESLERSLFLRPTTAKSSLSPGSIQSLNETQHWTGSAFSLPHDSVLDVSEIPPLPKQIDINEVPWWTSKRFNLSVICFFGTLVLQATRISLSIAIVSMVARTTDEHLNVTKLNNVSLIQNITLNVDNCPVLDEEDLEDGELQWDKEQQGLILGSFFWGYFPFQVFTGWLSAKFGAKRVVGITMFGAVLASMLSPICARTSPYLFMAVRILLGIFQCAFYPSIQTLWTKWAPPHERSRLLAISFAGFALGNAAMLPLGGLLSYYGFDGGWPSVFYVIGMIGFVWTCVWCIFCYDHPSQNPSISKIEKDYIEFYLGIQNIAKRKKHPVPWGEIVKSKAVYAIVIAHTCANFGNYMYSTQLPTYYKENLKLDVKSNGLYSMLPYLCLWIIMMFTGYISDCLIVRKILSVANTRKLMTHIGMVFPGLLLIGLGYMNCNQQIAALIIVTMTVSLGAFHMTGFFVNMSDIAPAYAGTIMGISNSVATIPGIIAPYVAGVLTTHGTRSEWQSVYYFSAGFLIMGSVIYQILGEGEVQSWGHVPHITEEDVGLSVDDDTDLDKFKTKSINNCSNK